VITVPAAPKSRSGSDSRRVLVFCASSRQCAPEYHALAHELGAALARAGMPIIYGGGAVGSMGALADGALAEGGEVIGIQPHFMAELEWAHSSLTRLELVDDMQERKRRMVAQCDAIVALPGGSGTLEELFEVMTAKRLGGFCGPIVIVNQGGFFDPMLAQLDRCIEEKMMDERHRTMWQLVSRADDVIGAIEDAPEWSSEALDFAAL
jgi:uncharacterized protein (TIGR00730 family)